MHPLPPGLGQPQTINFENCKQAQLITVDGSADPVAVLQNLGVEPPEAVIVISGGANTVGKGDMARLAPFFNLGIARAAHDLDAVIIDGGTQAGVMEMMGKAVADQTSPVSLIGVAPSEKVCLPGDPAAENSKGQAQLDPNHSHFILVQCENWGGETATMYKLAETLHRGMPGKVGDEPARAKILPTLTILISGKIGGIVLKEAQATVRKGWPLVVIEGSGQLPDEIARRFRNRRSQGRIWVAFSRLGAWLRNWRNPALQEADAIIDEIVDDGEIILFSLNSRPSDLEKLLVKRLAGKQKDSVLLRAWKRFAVYDLNASRHQKTYHLLKSWPISLGVWATALILGQEFLITNRIIQEGDIWFQLLRVLIVLLPIIVSIFLAADRLFKSGNKWLLLRYYAEEIKKDIYSYRVLSALTPPQGTSLPKEENELSARLTQLSQRLMRTEVNESALRPYNGPIPPRMHGAAADDDGLSRLDADGYANIRINDQLNFYASKTNKLEGQLQPRQWLILIFGAIGSLLAALGGVFQFWVPLTVTLVTALTAYLEYQQVEQTIIKYNQAMTKLTNLGDDWAALSPAEKMNPENIVKLVEEVESVNQSEHLGWVQQMQTIQPGSDKPHSAAEKKYTGADDHLDGNGSPAAELPELTGDGASKDGAEFNI